MFGSGQQNSWQDFFTLNSCPTIQGGPKKLGLYKYISMVLQFFGFLNARDKIKDSFGKLIKYKFLKWPIQSILSQFQMHKFRKLKSKVVKIIVEISCNYFH